MVGDHEDDPTIQNRICVGRIVAITPRCKRGAFTATGVRVPPGAQIIESFPAYYFCGIQRL